MPHMSDKPRFMQYKYLISPGAMIGDGDRKRAPFLVLGLAP